MTAPAEPAITAMETANWYNGKSFSSDWTSLHFPTWLSILAAHRPSVSEALEIGSWEGRSAIFWLNYFERCTLTCIDTFSGSQEHQTSEFSPALAEVEQRFDDNLATLAQRLRKIKTPSQSALADLGISGRQFDFIYVDGSHRAADVYADAMLAWPLLNNGGLMLFDDYTWNVMPLEMDRPKLGIDTFLRVAQGVYRELHRDLQILIQKT
jgi:predicted O-methyltransferase YrrM